MAQRKKDSERPAPVTRTPEHPPNETPSPDELDDLVDEAVEESFPASDPPAIGGDWVEPHEDEPRGARRDR